MIDAGGNLKAAAAFDYEVKNAYSVRVRSTDAGGFWVKDDFTIAVTDVNEAPIADEQSALTVKNIDVGVSLNGSDAETPVAGLTYTVTQAPAHGTLSGTAPNLVYTPAAGYAGPDSIQYTVSDAGSPSLTSAAATVSITVLASFGTSISRSSLASRPASDVSVSSSRFPALARVGPGRIRVGSGSVRLRGLVP